MDGPPGSGRSEHETAAGRHDHELRARVVTWPPLRLARLRCERGSVDVVQARWLPKKRWRSHGDHRHGHSSLVRAGGVPARRAGRSGSNGSISFTTTSSGSGSRSRSEDEVVVEATGNSAAVERILRPFVKRVVVASAGIWFGRSPMPGLRRTRSTRRFWPSFMLVAFSRGLGGGQRTPNDSGVRRLNAWVFSSRSFAPRDAFRPSYMQT